MAERVVLATGVDPLDKQCEEKIVAKGHLVVGKAYYRGGVKIVSDERKAGVVVLSPQLPGTEELLDIIRELRLYGTRVVLLPGNREDHEAISLVRQAVALGVYDVVWDLVSPEEVAAKVDNPGSLKDVGVDPDFSAVTFIKPKPVASISDIVKEEKAPNKEEEKQKGGFFSRLFGKKATSSTKHEETETEDKHEQVQASLRKDTKEASETSTQQKAEESTFDKEVKLSSSNPEPDLGAIPPFDEDNLFKPIARKHKKNQKKIDPLELLGLGPEEYGREVASHKESDASETSNEQASSIKTNGIPSYSEMPVNLWDDTSSHPSVEVHKVQENEPEGVVRESEQSITEPDAYTIENSRLIASVPEQENNQETKQNSHEKKIIQVMKAAKTEQSVQALPKHGVVFVVSPGNAALSGKVAVSVVKQAEKAALICGANASTAALDLGMDLQEVASSDWRLPGSEAPITFMGVDVWPIDPQKFVMGGRKDMLWAVISQARRRHSLVVVDAAADIDVLASKGRGDVVLAVKAGNEGDWLLEQWAEQNKDHNVVLFVDPSKEVSISDGKNGYVVQIG